MTSATNESRDLITSTWQYQSIVVPGADLGDEGSGVEVLNDFGELGWELVSAIRVDSGVAFYLKRERSFSD
jgi:hypothetical protein